MEQIDAIIMGRNTYEKVLSFGIDWPYPKPVFVLSTTLNKVPENFNGDVRFVNGELSEVLDSIHSKGFKNLYIDGGATIQSFLKEDLIEELILTTIPIVLGNGIPLFKDLPKHITFELTQSIIFLDTVVQNHFKRKIF